MALVAPIRLPSPLGRAGWLRSCLGALCGITVTGLVCKLFLGGAGAAPFLIAPMGASAVLLFGVPASPLAQPWPVIGGNTISALVATACAAMIPEPALAAGAAIAAAIAVMSLTRSLHPPGGAVAVTVALGGPAVAAAGWSFAFVPVALNSALMLGMAWAFNNATGHRYPHRAPAAGPSPHETQDPAPQDRIGPTSADVEDVLSQYEALLDIDRGDLEALFRRLQARARRRLHGVIACERIMSRDVIVAAPEEGVGQARDRLLARRLEAMPVIDEARRVLGVVGHAELLAGQGRTVGQTMNRAPHRVGCETPIDELLPVLSSGRAHETVVVDAQGRLLGIVTRTDLLAALWRRHVAEQAADFAGLP